MKLKIKIEFNKYQINVKRISKNALGHAQRK